MSSLGLSFLENSSTAISSDRCGLPAAALREYQKIANSGWRGTGVPLPELLGRINRVAEHLAPEESGRNSRVKRTFTERSFRHYQTIGCIDPPEKEERRSTYGFRHFVQALLVRRLLWERVPSDQITVVMGGRGTEEMERMFLGGMEMVAKEEGRGSACASGSLPPGATETWKRVWVAPGVELHLRDGLKKLGAGDLRTMLGALEKALRQAH